MPQRTFLLKEDVINIAVKLYELHDKGYFKEGLFFGNKVHRTIPEIAEELKYDEIHITHVMNILREFVKHKYLNHSKNVIKFGKIQKSYVFNIKKFEEDFEDTFDNHPIRNLVLKVKNILPK